MAKALAWRVAIDVSSIAAEIDKEISRIGSTSAFSGQLLNTATAKRNGEEYTLYPFLDKGTKSHVIRPDGNGLLANEGQDFIVHGAVEHPDTAPYDITSRTLSYFEGVFSRAVGGSSTRSLVNRVGEEIPLSLIRDTFNKALLSAKRYAEQITPNSWVAVKSSYELRVNGRKIEE